MVDTIWIGSPNHYTGRNGYRVTHVTLHIMVGRLAGTDATFQDTARRSSSTYGIGSTGIIHQYVRESDTPWTDSNYRSNRQTISIEHEGGMDGVPCTKDCMDASAALCADIARRYGWPKLWHDGLNGNVWLHREIPGSDHATCPDLAVNGLDVNYVISKANTILKGEEDMSAEQVAQYHWAGDKSSRNIYDKLRYLEEGRTWDDKTHSSPIGNLVIGQPIAYGNTTESLGNRLAYIDQHTHIVDAKLEAILAAISALGQAMGADPNQIAAAVEDAVKAKLDALEINITATDRKE